MDTLKTEGILLSILTGNDVLNKLRRRRTESGVKAARSAGEGSSRTAGGYEKGARANEDIARKKRKRERLRVAEKKEEAEWQKLALARKETAPILAANEDLRCERATRRVDVLIEVVFVLLVAAFSGQNNSIACNRARNRFSIFVSSHTRIVELRNPQRQHLVCTKFQDDLTACQPASHVSTNLAQS